jgi:hypothetical protein
MRALESGEGTVKLTSGNTSSKVITKDELLSEQIVAEALSQYRSSVDVSIRLDL